MNKNPEDVSPSEKRIAKRALVRIRFSPRIKNERLERILVEAMSRANKSNSLDDREIDDLYSWCEANGRLPIWAKCIKAVVPKDANARESGYDRPTPCRRATPLPTGEFIRANVF